MSVNIVDKNTGNITKVAGNPIEQASGISYDHTSSGMQANNVQAAVDELKSGLTEVSSKLTGLNYFAVANENETYMTQYDGFYIFGNITLPNTFALLYLQANTQYTVTAQGFGISDPASGQAKTLFKIVPAVG